MPRIYAEIVTKKPMGSEEQKVANEKPCLTCTRVECPADCKIKNCKAWRDWWIEKWEEMRSVVKMDGAEDG